MNAILFDFNGTLFDDTRFHIAAWTKFLNEIHGLRYSEQDILSVCLGPNNSKILKHIFPELSHDVIMQYSFDKEQIYRDIAGATEETRRLIDGVPEMFDMLVERNIPFAMATASEIHNINFYMDVLGLKRWFTMDRIVYDQGMLPSKPNPAYYAEAAKLLGVDLHDCMIVEDSASGIQAAINAKCAKIIAVDRTQGREALAGNPAIDAVIHDFRGFERFLED